jgi:hypothetical protein
MATLPDLPSAEIAIIELTNAFRKENRLGDVRPNAALAAAARAFAHYLAKTGKFAHEADGREPHERALEHGYRFCMVAENLALNIDSRGFETKALAAEVVQGWKKSPGHRRNLLQRTATEIGVAVVRATHKHPKYISVQLFGRPETLKVEFSIENRAGAAIGYALGEETHTLSPRAAATHTSCDAEALTFEKAGLPLRHYEPRNGDRFVVRPGAGGIVEVNVERK